MSVSPPADAPPDGLPETTSLFARARLLCEQQGLAWRGLREDVLRCLHDRGGCARAYDLLADLQTASARKLAPTSIYRVLDFFTAHGLVHKVEANSMFVLCKATHQPHLDPVLLVCDRCGRVTESHDPVLEQWLASRADGLEDFAPHSIEIRGDCGCLRT